MLSMMYRKSYYVTHPLALAKHLRREIKYFYQRGKRGYSDADVWSLDWYLNSWLPEALESLKGQLHGHPTNLCDGVHDFNCPEACCGEQKWIEALDSMIDGFKAAREIESGWLPKEDPAWERFNKGMKAFHEHYFSL